MNYAMVLYSATCLLSASTPVYPAAPSPNRPAASDHGMVPRISRFVWCGKSPNGAADWMLIATLPHHLEEGTATLDAYELRKGDCPNGECDTLVRAHRWSGPMVGVIQRLHVYRDAKGTLYAALDLGGASTAGVWVLAIPRTGSAKTLYFDMNRGEPRFRLSKGVPEIRELWEIARLMKHGWHPTRAFDKHVLVERIYRLGPKGVFQLKSVQPAPQDEKRLSAKDFQGLEQERRFEESQTGRR